MSKANRPKGRSDKPPLGVSATITALHLSMSRPYLEKLVSGGVIPRSDDGRFDLDKCRAAYIAHLRAVRRTSPATEAKAAFDRARARELQIKNGVRERRLMNTDEAIATIDEMAGVILTALSGMPARVALGDLNLKRRLEAAVYDVRKEIADAAGRLADEYSAAQQGDDNGADAAA